MIVKSQFVAQMAQTNSSNWVGPVHRPVPLTPGRMPCYSQLKMAHLWPPILFLLLNQVPLLVRKINECPLSHWSQILFALSIICGVFLQRQKQIIKLPQ